MIEPRSIVTAAVFLLVLVLVIARPRRTSEAVPALAGALLLLVVGAARQWPLGVVASASGAGLVLLALAWRRLTWRTLLGDIS